MTNWSIWNKKTLTKKTRFKLMKHEAKSRKKYLKRLTEYQQIIQSNKAKSNTYFLLKISDEISRQFFFQNICFELFHLYYFDEKQDIFKFKVYHQNRCLIQHNHC